MVKVASFFSGCGGLDLGFQQAGFTIEWGNDNDTKLMPTLRHNFPDMQLCTESINKLVPADLPSGMVGFIGGPPCQSWSIAGAGRGVNDKRGQAFTKYISLVTTYKPLFFVAENVAGITYKKHNTAFRSFLNAFMNAGYDTSTWLVNANDYGVAQDRERIFIIGYRQDLHKSFSFPPPTMRGLTLRDAIGDLPAPTSMINGHEFDKQGFSPLFLSRQRVREWDGPSFTIQAAARQCPLHPSAPLMERVNRDKWVFKPGHEHEYRRLTVRECARVQGFPDDFQFLYDKIHDGYRMVGNAVPPPLARVIAEQIMKDIFL